MLEKTMIIDNVPDNFKLQKYNGIIIKSWINDPKDTALKDMIHFLLELLRD